MVSGTPDGWRSLLSRAGEGTLHAPEPTISLPAANEREVLAGVLARAFRDNPLNVAVIRGSSRRRERSNFAGMRMVLESEAGQATLLVARGRGGARAEKVVGGLIALAPDAYPLPSPPFWGQLRTLLSQGLGAARRWGQVFGELQESHPLEPHWYLSVLGVEPDQHGRGIGSALLSDWLAQVDVEGMPAYLETDREENLSFYQQRGFRVLASRELMQVPIWTMWRDGRPSGSGRESEVA
jgi:ribosomal protein S18 acetylase RimI-like enzyme